MHDMDIFYISYDEPQKEDFWQKISTKIPSAQRVDGIKGFHKAHQTCAMRAKTNRFFTIDGDAQISDAFFDLHIPKNLLLSPYVLSWSSRNTVNGLSYGNGGIKSWPQNVLLHSKTHEESIDKGSTIDFCFSLQYYLMPEELSSSHIAATPLQAFRAGFREGIKMALNGGEKVDTVPASHVLEKIHFANLERLKIWCSVGSDVENGLWAILGARKGLHFLYCENTDHTLIRDYDWFNQYWEQKIINDVSDDNIISHIQHYGSAIKTNLNLNLVLFSPEESQFFKSVYVNRTRRPQLLRWN